MKYAIALFGMLVLWGCRSQHPEPRQVRPVKITEAVRAEFVDKDFVGMATADNAVNLAFKISGQILSLPVAKGDLVRKGQLLAELDPRDMRLANEADRSVYEQAKSQLERTERLLEHQAVSRSEYEQARTRYAQAKSAYENSLDALHQTRLLAPFAGVIERKSVEVYQRVIAGETILRLVDPESDKVEFTISESGLALLEHPGNTFTVMFDAYRGVSFPAVLKDYAKTSSDASGFPVALTLREVDRRKYRISPGMSCTITMQTPDELAGAVSLPLSAIYAPASGGDYVWIVGPDNRVRMHEVRLGGIYGTDRVIIDSGVAAGDRIVTAGVYQLQENDSVRILPNAPQR